MTDLFFILVESGLGICSFAHFLLCPGANQSCRSSLICSFVKSDLSDWLLHSLHKSNREQTVPIALYKRATISNSLPSLFKMRDRAKSDGTLFRSQKMSNLLEKPKSTFSFYSSYIQ